MASRCSLGSSDEGEEEEGGGSDTVEDGVGVGALLLLLGEEDETGTFPSARAVVKASTNSLFSRKDLVLIPYDSSSFFSSTILMVGISGGSEAAICKHVVEK